MAVFSITAAVTVNYSKPLDVCVKNINYMLGVTEEEKKEGVF